MSLLSLFLQGVVFLFFALGVIFALAAMADWMLYPWESPRHWRLDRYNTLGEMMFKGKWRKRE